MTDSGPKYFWIQPVYSYSVLDYKMFSTICTYIHLHTYTFLTFYFEITSNLQKHGQSFAKPNKILIYLYLEFPNVAIYRSC